MGYPANACDLLLEPSGDRAEFINKKCYTSYTNSGWANTCGNWDCTYGDSGGCCAGCVIGSNKSNCRNPDRCDCRYPLALTVTYDETCQS